MAGSDTVLLNRPGPLNWTGPVLSPIVLSQASIE